MNEHEMLEKIELAMNSDIEQIKLTQKQLDKLEVFVVAYMAVSSQKNELGEGVQNLMLTNLDKVWDSLFEVEK